MFTSKGVIQIAFIISGEKQALLRPNSFVHFPGHCQMRPIFPVPHFFVLTAKDINTVSSDVDVYTTDIKFRQSNPTLLSPITDHTNNPAFLLWDSKTETFAALSWVHLSFQIYPITLIVHYASPLLFHHQMAISTTTKRGGKTHKGHRRGQIWSGKNMFRWYAYNIPVASVTRNVISEVLFNGLALIVNRSFLLYPINSIDWM